MHAGITTRGGVFDGKGRKCNVLNKKEEEMIKDHVIYKAKIGYGKSWKTLKKLIQKMHLRIKKKSPNKMTGLEEQGQRPSISWLRRLAIRNGISLRKCSIISKGQGYLFVFKNSHRQYNF